MKTLWQQDNEVLREEFNDGGEGSSGFDPGSFSNDGGSDPGGYEPEANPESPEQPHAPSAPAFDYDQMASAFAKVIPQAPAAAAPQMTQEEFNKAMKRWDVTPEHIEAIYGANATPESRLAAYQAMTNGINTHVFTVVGEYIKGLRAEIDQRFQPIQQQAAAQSYKSFEAGLYAKHAWAKPLAQFVGPVIAQLRASGASPKTQDEAYDLIAKGVESMAKVANPNFARPTAASSSRSSLPSMAGMSNGGGGSAGGGSRQPSKPAWQAAGLFGPKPARG